MRRFIAGFLVVVAVAALAGCGSPAAPEAASDPAAVQAAPDAPLEDRPNVPGNDPR